MLTIRVHESTNKIPTDSEITSVLERRWGFREECQDFIKYTQSVIRGFTFPLSVWRGVYVPPGKTLRLDSTVGTHWTYNYDMFTSNKSPEWFTAGKLNVILYGHVRQEQVNWNQTILDIASDYDPKRGYASPTGAEYEIELKKGEIPDDLEIWEDTRSN
jgi:hypothetical protein